MVRAERGPSLHLPERLAYWRTDHAHQLTGHLIESFAAQLDFRRALEIFRPDPAGRRRGCGAPGGADIEDEMLSRWGGRMFA